MSARPAELREHVALAPFTTFQVGGAARLFLEVHDRLGLAEALAWARTNDVPTMVLGGGSNVLVSDSGFDGLVLRVRTRGMRATQAADGSAIIEVGAGEPFDAFVDAMVGKGYGGVECLSGIPGQVGATPIQNVGAYGQEVAETIDEVRAIDRSTGVARIFDKAACRFAYRTSIFKESEASRYVVTSVTFHLRPCARPVVRYRELEQNLREQGVGAPTVAQVRTAVLAIRRAKSMLIEPADPNHRSAGSFFVNPTVTPDVAALVEETAKSWASEGLAAMPRFAAAGGVKLSAAWLIERSGFAKGIGDGPVGLSTGHALCIVNRGTATARQIVAFAVRIRRAVRERFGVALATEPVRVGFAEQEDSGLLD